MKLGLLVGFLTEGVGVSLTLACLGDCFPLLGCLMQPKYKARCYALLQLDVPHLADIHGVGQAFSEAKRSGWGWCVGGLCAEEERREEKL